MKNAFTLIELIFVIVIIGILATVVMPKLAVNRNDATSSLCAHEVGQLIHEIGNMYTSKGYSEFKDMPIATISNVLTSVGVNENGIVENASTTVDSTGITYNCEGESVVKLVCNKYNTEYNLTITSQNPVTPVGLGTEEKLIMQNIISTSGVRNYKL